MTYDFYFVRSIKYQCKYLIRKQSKEDVRANRVEGSVAPSPRQVTLSSLQAAFEAQSHT